MNSHTHVSTRWEETVRYFFLLLPQGICHRKILKHTSDSVILNTRLIVELETQPPLPVKRPKFDLWSVCLLKFISLFCPDAGMGPELRNLFGIILTIESLCGRAEKLKKACYDVYHHRTRSHTWLLDVHLFTLEMEEEEFDLWPDLRVLCHDETNSHVRGLCDFYFLCLFG